MASEWFYTRDGKTKSGPVSSAQLKALVRSGRLLPTDVVWRPGMCRWIPASGVKGLFSSASAAAKPPPLAPPVPTKNGGGAPPVELAAGPGEGGSLASRSVRFILGQPTGVLAAGAALFGIFAGCGFFLVSGMFSRH